MQPATVMRHRLADTAAQLGPDADTLCRPWDVRALVAHEVARESRPDMLPGNAMNRGLLRRHTDAVQGRIAEMDFGDLLDRLRGGPPPLWPTRLPVLDTLVNTAEFAIHHEDMVRAQPGWEPSELGDELQEALWSTLRRAGRVLYRSAPVGVVAVAPGHGRIALRRPPRDAGSVVLRGTPLELLLHAFGRTGVARVRIEGDEHDVAALAFHRRAV